ncbi:CbtA family protein [Herbidospora cretacea]|uniref:CbtA family protein n=1 Tax=Herbidospora cretacea TaxID=28444 RepID=UPI000A94E63A|nr:CbtA family protein [Herbidospora cretacea]
MIKDLFLRGLGAGAVAGLLAGLFGFLVGEPFIDQAIAIEEAAAGAGHSHADELVSRGGQAFGLFLATTLYGIVVGGLFALVYALVKGRFGPANEQTLAVTLAAGGFLAVVLVPFLKYPGNPPAVGDPETIGQRTVLYLVMLAIGLLALGAGAVVHRRYGWVAAVPAFLVIVGVAYAVLPAIQEVPGDFPAVLLWNFRVSSLGMQAVLWGVLGSVFALLSARRRVRV